MDQRRQVDGRSGESVYSQRREALILPNFRFKISPMKRLALLTLSLLVLGAYLIGCDSADNPIAPSGSSLTMTASPTSIALTGESSNLTITGFKPDGNPLNPGTQLTISTTRGVLTTNTSNNSLIEVGESGRATATLTGDGRQGTATVTVSLTSGGEASTASSEIQIGVDAGDKPTVQVEANPTEIALNDSSEITVTARNADGTIMTSGTVAIRTSLGILTSGSSSGSSLSIPFSNSTGRVTASLSSSQAGSATVTASVGASDEDEVTVEIGTALKPTLTISANPRIVDVLQRSEITLSIRDQNGNLVSGNRTVFLTGDLGRLSTTETGTFTASLEVSVSNGRRTVYFQAGDVPGAGGISGFVGNSDTATVSIEIRDAPAAVGLTPSTSIVTRTTESSITLTALVTDSRSNRVPNEIVTFNAVNSAGESLSFDCSELACAKATGSNGLAELTITFQANTIPASVTSFSVTASVRGGDPSDTKQISVQ